MTTIISRNTTPALRLRAGATALHKIREHGLSPALVSHLAAAAGGPKWLILGRLEQQLFGHWLRQSDQPVRLIGASIGAWCMASAAQTNPVAGLQHFEEVYLSQRYGEKTTAAMINAECERLLEEFLTDQVIAEILANPRYQLSVITMRCTGALGSDRRVPLLWGLAKLILYNSISRGLMGRAAERVIFHTGSPIAMRPDGIPTHFVQASAQNLRAAVMASGMLPLFMLGMRDIPGAPAGTYRDGGTLDYHMDLPLKEDDGIVLLPHFFEGVTAGWFDRMLPWRGPVNLANTLMVIPSNELLARLPHQRVPSRKDFYEFAGRDEERLRIWHIALGEAQRMADEWGELAASGRLEERLEPLE